MGHHTNSPQQQSDGPFWHKQCWLCQKDLRPMIIILTVRNNSLMDQNCPKKLTVPYGSWHEQSTTTTTSSAVSKICTVCNQKWNIIASWFEPWYSAKQTKRNIIINCLYQCSFVHSTLEQLQCNTVIHVLCFVPLCLLIWQANSLQGCAKLLIWCIMMGCRSTTEACIISNSAAQKLSLLL